MDAEIARLRERRRHGLLDYGDTRALLDALEQAQKERDDWKQAAEHWMPIALQAQKELAESKEVRASTLASYDRAITNYGHVVSQRDQARKDAKDARALLRYLSKHSHLQQRPGLVARIGAVLEQKP